MNKARARRGILGGGTRQNLGIYRFVWKNVQGWLTAEEALGFLGGGHTRGAPQWWCVKGREPGAPAWGCARGEVGWGGVGGGIWGVLLQGLLWGGLLW